MKTLALLALALLPLAANAKDELSCQSTKRGPDHGYYVEISRNFERAEVSMQSFAGPQRLASLDCAHVTPPRRNPGNDKPRVFLTCSDPKAPDSGYLVRLAKGGLAGLTTGTLSQATVIEDKQIATLICK